MTDGTATGMITAGELKAELDRKRAADREEFARLDAATTGRGAETVRRCHVVFCCRAAPWCSNLLP